MFGQTVPGTDSSNREGPIANTGHPVHGVHAMCPLSLPLTEVLDPQVFSIQLKAFLFCLQLQYTASVT